MLAPISGARLIHSPIGAAISVTTNPPAATMSTTRTTAVTQGGDRPSFWPRFMIGAKVMAISAAARMGSRIGRAKLRQVTSSRRKIPTVAICAAVPQRSAVLASGCGSMITGA